jgi:hypothetical protein
MAPQPRRQVVEIEGLGVCENLDEREVIRHFASF